MSPDCAAPAVIVRPSLDTDLPRIAAIYGHWVLHGLASFELTPPTAGEMAHRRSTLLEQRYPYLVATDRATGAVLGFAYAGPYRARPAYSFSVEDSVYVAPDAGRRGVGRALLERLIAECETLGFRQMIAVIGDSANVASIELHARLGFAHAGLLPAVGWKFERWVDSVLMVRALGAGSTTAPERARRSRTPR